MFRKVADLYRRVLGSKMFGRKVVAPTLQTFHVPDPAPRKSLVQRLDVPGAFGRNYGLNGKRNPRRACKHFRLGQKVYQPRGY